MPRQLRYFAVLGCFALLLGYAQAEPADNALQDRRLAEQKLKLVEMLLDAPATKAGAAGRDASAATLIEHSRSLIGQARQAIAEQHYGTATQVLDEALRKLFKANSRQPDDSSVAESKQKQQFHDLAEQLATYRASLQDMSKDATNGPAAARLLTRVDRLSDEGRQLYLAGKLAEGGKKMAEAYRLAVTEIAQLRAGQEVVMSLKFASPADEFAYELKRYQSNEILAGMMIGEGRADGERRQQVDGLLGEAERLKEEAGIAAKAADFRTAIGTMEQANARINRALQAMGLPVF